MPLITVGGFESARSATAQTSLEAGVQTALERELAGLTELRHHLHQHPELSNREVETAKLVAERLRALGLEVKTGIAKTGVIAVLKGGKPGRVVGVRADIDALPVTEATDLPFRSIERTTFLNQEVGVSHACGHDIHTTVGIGTAAALAAVRQNLAGTVVFYFQPAEEGPPPGEKGGASLMLEEGAFTDFPKPEAIFALHAFSELGEGVEATVGRIGWTSGPAFASVDQFVIKLRGKQSHGAYPHQGIDPIVVASQVVMAFQTIRSRTLPALEPSVVTVGIFRAGERFNIIPGEVHLEGTVRTYSDSARSTVERRMREILGGLTAAYGASYELDYKQNAPATINDPKLAAWARPVLERSAGAANVLVAPPTMGGEDFSYFAREVPGFYFRLGVVKPGTQSGSIHTPTFRADDSSLPVGIRAMTALVLAYLESGGPG